MYVRCQQASQFFFKQCDNEATRFFIDAFGVYIARCEQCTDVNSYKLKTSREVTILEWLFKPIMDE